MVWQGGLSSPASLGFTDTSHIYATLHTTGSQMLSLLGQAASPTGTEKIHGSLH